MLFAKMPTSARMGKTGPCCHCGIASTPLWRNGPPDKPVLCNACGSRWRTRGSLDNYMPMHVGGIDGSGAVSLATRAIPKKVVAPKKSEIKRKAGSPDSGDPLSRNTKRVRKPTTKFSTDFVGSPKPFFELHEADSEETQDTAGPLESDEQEDHHFIWKPTLDKGSSGSSGSLTFSIPSSLSHLPADPSPVSVLSAFTKRRTLPKRPSLAISNSDLAEPSDNLMPPSPGTLLTVTNPSQSIPGEIGLGGSIIGLGASIFRRERVATPRGRFAPPQEVGAKKRGPKVQKEVKESDSDTEDELEPRVAQDPRMMIQKANTNSILKKSPCEDSMVLTHRKSPLTSVDLRDIVNPTTYRNTLSRKDRQELSKFLPSVDREGNDSRLQHTLHNKHFESAITTFQTLLEQGAFEPSSSSDHYEELLTTVDLHETGWPEKQANLKVIRTLKTTDYEKNWGAKLGPLHEIDEDAPSGTGPRTKFSKLKPTTLPHLPSPPESTPDPETTSSLPNAGLFGKSKLSILLPEDIKIDDLPSLGRLDSTRSLLGGGVTPSIFEQQVRAAQADYCKAQKEGSEPAPFGFDGVLTPTLGSLRQAFADPMWDIVMDSQPGRVPGGAFLEVGESPR